MRVSFRLLVMLSCWMRLDGLGRVAVTLVVLAACSSDESPVRGNVQEIFRGHLWHDDSCSEQHFENCCLERGVTTCTTYDHVVVAAVRHQGDRVGVLILSNGDHLVLAQSEDRGKSWKTTEINDTDFIRGGQGYTGPLDLVMTTQATWLFIARDESGALGQSYTRGHLYSVNAGGELLGGDPTLPGGPPIEVRDGRAIIVVPDSDPRSGDVSLLVYELSPGSSTPEVAGIVPCTEPGCKNLRSAAFLGTE